MDGLGKHGHARLLHPGLSRYGRLTPEAIDARAESREQAVRWLRTNGYILDAGQVPTGAIRGQRIGFGQHGHGGAYKGGRNAEIIRALNTDVRDPLEIGTMTAAEQRMFTASRDLELVRQGVHPYSESALLRRGAPRFGGTEAELTPEVTARFERHYYITMHAQGEALEMKRLQRLVPGKPLSAVDTAEVYAHNAARKIALGERSAQARAAREAIEGAKRTITDAPKPLAGGKGGGVKPPASRLTEGAPDEPWDAHKPEKLPVWSKEVPEVEISDASIRVAWYGKGTHGAHGDVDGPPNKSYLHGWTIEEFTVAARYVSKNPDFVRIINGRVTEIFGIYRDHLFRIVPVPENARKPKHINPERGADVRWRYPVTMNRDHRIIPFEFDWEGIHSVS